MSLRILILGAGGTGGYFGGRLAQSGADVTFLVRPARARELDRDGLRIRSPLGDARIDVAHVTAEALPARVAAQPFDLVILSCKAYDLDTAVDAIAPAMTGATTLMPILNGLRHYPLLDARFGRDQVFGGLCFISATKGPGGEILHLGKPASMTFGERDAAPGDGAASSGEATSARGRALSALCEQAGIDHKLSTQIALDQWIKYSFLTALAAGTCLMRSHVGGIVASEGGAAFMAGLHEECLAVAAAAGHAVPDKARDIARATLVQPGSDTKASMLRDLEAGQRVEAAQIVGDMLQRARQAGVDAPLLQTAWVHLQAYEGALEAARSAQA
jgi:2-dehydropantoate 2-reductase